MQFLHDKNGTSSACLLLPHATKVETTHQVEKIQKENLYKLIHNNTQAQIVQYQNLTAYAIWQAGEYNGIVFNQPTIALFDQDEVQSNAKLLVVEPTQTANQLSIILDSAWQLDRQNTLVKTQIKEGKLHLLLNTKGLSGKPIELTLKQ